MIMMFTMMKTITVESNTSCTMAESITIISALHCDMCEREIEKESSVRDLQARWTRVSQKRLFAKWAFS